MSVVHYRSVCEKDTGIVNIHAYMRKLSTILLSKICPKIRIEITFSITLDKKKGLIRVYNRLTFLGQDLAS